MVTALLDTTILVDILRSHPPAIQWGQMQSQALLGITPVVWMEIVAGSQNKNQQMRAVRLMQRLEMIFFTQADLEWAMSQQLLFHLSHGIGILDCLIASASYRLNIPLLTLNLKHFAPLLNNLAQKPY